MSQESLSLLASGHQKVGMLCELAFVKSLVRWVNYVYLLVYILYSYSVLVWLI